MPWETQLVGFLADKDLLLILDNFEHLVEAAPFLERLLDSCPRVVALVTSRHTLMLRMEHVHEVRGLAYPEEADDPDFWEFDAPRLFVRTAGRLGATVRTEAADRENLLRICRATGGLPLALELAASWLSVLPLGAIADRL